MNNINGIPPYRIPNYITSPRKMSYKKWLLSPVMELSEDDSSVYKKVYLRDGDYFTHKDFIYYFTKDLIDVLFEAGFNIENEKEFKREVAIFIYRLSKEKHNDR